MMEVYHTQKRETERLATARQTSRQDIRQKMDEASKRKKETGWNWFERMMVDTVLGQPAYG